MRKRFLTPSPFSNTLLLQPPLFLGTAPVQHHPRAVRGPSSPEEGSHRQAKAPLLIQEGRSAGDGGGYKPQTAEVVTSRKPPGW